jgi:molybdopterin converting factor small subunit
VATVRIKMLGTLRSASKENEEELTVPADSNVGQVVERLSKSVDVARATLSTGVSLIDHVRNALILLNGVEINNLQGLRTPVEDGDTLVFVSVTHGG